MMEKYRHDMLNQHMNKVEEILTSISNSNRRVLNVMKFIKDNPNLSFEEATILGMKEQANEAMIQVSAVATSLDRTLAMVSQMVKEMDQNKLENAKRFHRRSEVLTNFDRIVEEMRPECTHKFAQR